MNSNIHVSDNNTVILHLGDESIKNKWESLFVSNGNKISNLIVSNNASVDYQFNKKHGMYDAVLHSGKEFVYKDIEKILDKMYHNGIGSKVMYKEGYIEAFRKLKADDRVFLPDNNPSFAICFDNENMIIRDIDGVDDVDVGVYAKNLVNRISRLITEKEDVKNNIHNVSISKKGNHFVFYGFNAINDFVDFLILCIEKEMSVGEENKSLIKNLAIKNFVKSELSMLKNIIQYPSYHPLSKYKSATSVIVEIFDNILIEGFGALSGKRSVNLKNAILGDGIFENVPPIIMRSIVKLRYRFGSIILK